MNRWIVVILLLLTSIGFAQTPPTPPTAEELNKLQAEITKQLTSADPGELQKGLEGIQKLWTLDKGRVQGNLRGSWLTALRNAKKYDEIEKWSKLCIGAWSQDLGCIEQLQTARVRNFLDQGQPEKALASVKGLFNSCSTGATGNVLLLIAECLNAAKGNTDLFKTEQMAGATFEGSKPLNDAGKRSTVLDAIKVDPAEWEKDIRAIPGEDFGSLYGRGNLLLLADRATEARQCFERMYAQATEPQLQQASESIARAMRAQDGTVGRANAWITAIRPPVQPKK